MEINDKSQNDSVLQAKLFEAKRIENYLRAEVSDLWEYINSIIELPFFKLFVKVSTKMQRIYRFRNTVLVNNINVEKEIIEKGRLTSYSSLDLLFVLPTDNFEIGGTQTSFKFITDLAKRNVNVKFISLQHDPTSIENDLSIKESQIQENSAVKMVVACGAETISKVEELCSKFNSKSVLLMLGADHYFTPTWKDSQNYQNAIGSFNIIIALSPFLEKIAKSLGAENVICAKLGPDRTIFPLCNLPRENLIVVPCRTSVEKGLRILLPHLPMIRNEGWRVIGFGDLAENEMASDFDEFLGRINSTKLSDLFSRAKILLDPSWIEGLGLVALEAASSGCVPIITKRKDYQGIFQANSLPFIEIDNFLDPEIILDAIKNADINFDPKTISNLIGEVDWMDGSKAAQDFLIDLLVTSK